MRKLYTHKEFEFVLITSLLALSLSGLYSWKGFIEGFSISYYILIFLNLVYIPIAIIFKKNGFPYYYLIYTLITLFIISKLETSLYNNYTCLLGIVLVILYNPKIKNIALALYFIAVGIAFLLINDPFYNIFIHIAKSIWLIYIFNTIITEQYPRKKLILFDDEIKILTELSKHRLQKSIEFEGFSESTIYRRIKSACNRNHLSKAELIEEFKKELEHNELEKK